MRRLFPILLILSLFLTSCIEIVEEITINKNKSGSLSIRVESDNAGTIMNIVNNFMGNSYEGQIKAELNRIAKKLQGEKGIQNVKVDFNERDVQYGISCDFSNSNDLNLALYKAFGYKKSIFSPGYLKVHKHKLKKLNIAPFVKMYLDKEDITIPDTYITDLINYECIYHLPNKIKGTSNKNAVINSTTQTVSIEFPIKEVLNNKVNTGIKIRH